MSKNYNPAESETAIRNISAGKLSSAAALPRLSALIAEIISLLFEGGVRIHIVPWLTI